MTIDRRGDPAGARKPDTMDASTRPDDWQYWVAVVALYTGSLIYWLPTPTGIQPLLQPLPGRIWTLLAS